MEPAENDRYNRKKKQSGLQVGAGPTKSTDSAYNRVNQEAMEYVRPEERNSRPFQAEESDANPCKADMDYRPR